MIKDIFKFKKSAWHAKLMTFVWGYKPTDFRNMCPYFWLSVVNVVFILPILFVKAFIKLLMISGKILHSISNSIDKACDSKAALWLDEKMDKVFQDTDYADMVIKAERTYGDGRRAARLRKVWRNIPWDKRTKLLEAYDLRRDIRINEEARQDDLRWEASRSKSKANAKKALSKAAKIGRATVVIKKIFNIVKYPIALGLLYLVYLGVSFLFTLVVSVDYSWVPRFLYVLYMIVGAVMGVVAFLIPIVSFISWGSCKLKGMCLPCEVRKERLMSFLRMFSFLKHAVYIIYPFIGMWWCMKGVWNGVKTFIELCLAVKKDNCPGLEWEE